DIANNNGTGLLVQNSKTNSFTLNVDSGGTANATVDTTNGTALDLDPLTVNLVFASVNANGGTKGINLESVDGSLTINGGSITNQTSEAFFVDAGTVSVTYSGNITQANNNSAVKVQNGHTGTLTFQTGTINATNGDGLQFNNADGTYNFNGTTTLNGGNAGIDIIGGSNGTFTFGSNSSITNPTGVAFNVNTSTGGNVTYNGTINQSNTVNAVAVSSKTGGTVTIAGLVTANTTTTSAVNLTNNTGGTVTFTGGLVLTTTTAVGFNVSGGGTLNITGTNNTVTSGTGIAVNIVNTTIGGSGVTFKSVSTNGASTGISLNNTGAGSFSVTGDGTTGGTLNGSNNGSGGTIIGASNDAISLINTGPVSIAQMRIGTAGTQANIGRSGIQATSVSGLTVLNTDFINASGDDTGGTNNFAAIRVTNADAGANITLTNNLFNRSFEDHVRIENGNGAAGVTLGTINVSQNFFNDNAVSGETADGFIYVGDENSNATIIVAGNTFNNSDDHHVNIDLIGGSASANVTIGGANAADGNTMTSSNTMSGTGIRIETEGSATNYTGTVTFLVQNNNIQNADGGGILIETSNKTTAGLKLSGTISDNIIGTLGDASSGGQIGIQLSTKGDGDAHVTIDNNNVQGWTDNNGILLNAGDGNTRLEMNVTNNTIGPRNPTPTGGEVALEIAAGGGADTSSILLNITGNTLDNTPDQPFGDLGFSTAAGATIEITNNLGITTDTVTNTAIKAYLQGVNAGTPTVFVGGAIGGVVGTAASPTLP
ncbi:MAG: hypothetical protein JKY45_09450, partial [Emcibacter sp.]|nr:hypothetical protein [Emcibacter sp.]